MGRNADRDRSGDQAAWSDLVARLELPSPVDLAHPPWPERENLRPAAHARPETADSDQQPGARQEVGEQPSDGKDMGALAQPDSPHDASPPTDTGHGARTPTTPGRVIRPARSMRFPVRADEQAQGAAGLRPGPADLPDLHGMPTFSPLSGLAPGWTFGPVAGPAETAEPAEHARDEPTSPDLDLPDWRELDENADERFIPPHTPPQPKLDPVARGAWTALFGGPGYLFTATTLQWQIPGWAELAAIIAFIAGFVVLVSRLGDGPSRRDGPDQGAVV
ncbi:MAG TPA: hypothetical protein VHJ18_05635 [Streptosporangiaceae bacterium]|nr:hypothetical protein [Streptosporangiaceae bacterium]